MGFREYWLGPNGEKVARRGYHPGWHRSYTHRVALTCDLCRPRSTSGSGRIVEPHEPLTPRQILAWLRENAPEWEMRIDPDVPLERKQFVGNPKTLEQQALLQRDSHRWKRVRELTEADLAPISGPG